MKVNRDRKLVPEQRCYVDFETNLGSVLKEVQALIKLYGKDAYIDGSVDPYSDSDKETFHVYTMEPESDEKYKERIAYEEKWAKESDERDAREFARLQAKFGNKV
jgi:hypothetical protein